MPPAAGVVRCCCCCCCCCCGVAPDAGVATLVERVDELKREFLYLIIYIFF